MFVEIKSRALTVGGGKPIIMTLVGYFYFQIYKNLDEGKRYSEKSSPAVVKNYKETRPKSIIYMLGSILVSFPSLNSYSSMQNAR